MRRHLLTLALVFAIATPATAQNAHAIVSGVEADRAEILGLDDCGTFAGTAGLTYDRPTGTLWLGRHEEGTWEAPPATSVDRDLLWWYVGAVGSKILDLGYTRVGIDTGQIKETNPALIEAERLARAAGFPRHVGREIASASITAGYILAVRQWVHPRSPTAAKAALAGLIVLNIALALLNRHNIKIVSSPR